MALYQFTWAIFDKLSLNAASCQTAVSTIFVHTSIEPELKDLKTTSS